MNCSWILFGSNSPYLEPWLQVFSRVTDATDTTAIFRHALCSRILIFSSSFLRGGWGGSSLHNIYVVQNICQQSFSAHSLPPYGLLCCCCWTYTHSTAAFFPKWNFWVLLSSMLACVSHFRLLFIFPIHPNASSTDFLANWSLQDCCSVRHLLSSSTPSFLLFILLCLINWLWHHFQITFTDTESPECKQPF